LSMSARPSRLPCAGTAATIKPVFAGKQSGQLLAPRRATQTPQRGWGRELHRHRQGERERSRMRGEWMRVWAGGIKACRARTAPGKPPARVGSFIGSQGRHLWAHWLVLCGHGRTGHGPSDGPPAARGPFLPAALAGPPTAPREAQNASVRERATSPGRSRIQEDSRRCVVAERWDDRSRKKPAQATSRSRTRANRSLGGARSAKLVKRHVALVAKTAWAKRSEKRWRRTHQ